MATQTTTMRSLRARILAGALVFLVLLAPAARSQGLGAISGGGAADTQSLGTVLGAISSSAPTAKPQVGANTGGAAADTQSLGGVLGAISSSSAPTAKPQVGAISGGAAADTQSLGTVLGAISSNGPSSSAPTAKPQVGANTGGAAADTQSLGGVLGAISSSNGSSSSAPTAKPAGGLQWDRAYTMSFTSSVKETSRVLQAFGPGVVPIKQSDPAMDPLRAKFDHTTHVAYPVTVATGFLKNGTRAGTLNIGIKDLLSVSLLLLAVLIDSDLALLLAEAGKDAKGQRWQPAVQRRAPVGGHL